MLTFLALAPATEPDMTRYLVVSGALLGALFLASFLVRRLVGTSRLTLGSRRGIQILEAASLGGSKKAVVVRCYDRTFLVGVGDKEVCSIAELDSESVDVDRGAPAAQAPSFAGLLGGAKPRRERPTAGSKPAATPASRKATPAPQPAAANVGPGDSRESEARRKVARELLDQLAERDLQPAPRETAPRSGQGKTEPRRVSDLLDGRGVVG